MFQSKILRPACTDPAYSIFIYQAKPVNVLEVRTVKTGWGGAVDWEGARGSLQGSWKYPVYLELGGGYKACKEVIIHKLQTHDECSLLHE